MDPFTQRMLERARARQEKIDQKLANNGQAVPKRKPLTENSLKTTSPAKTPAKTVKERLSQSPANSPNRKSSLKNNSKPPLSDVIVRKEVKTPKRSNSSRKSDVSVEINIKHSDDIQIEVQVEERDAPLTIHNIPNSSSSSVAIKEIDGCQKAVHGLPNGSWNCNAGTRVPSGRLRPVFMNTPKGEGYLENHSFNKNDLKSQASTESTDKSKMINSPKKETQAALRQNVKSRLDRLGVLYSDKAELSSPIHRTESEFSAGTPPIVEKDEDASHARGAKKFGRLAALADEINNWEDDLSHHNFHPEPVKKPSKFEAKKQDSSTLDVSIHSLQDISKVIDTSAKSKQAPKKETVNTKTFTKSSSSTNQQLDKNIVAELESDGYRRVSAAQSRLVYDFKQPKSSGNPRAQPKRASPTLRATSALDMAAAVARPPLAKKPSIKKYKAPTPPVKDKENNELPSEDNDNVSNSVTKQDPRSKGSPRKMQPKSGDRNSVLSKAAMFEAGSPKAKDPAEMSLRERKALFEKNKGFAIVPKAPFGQAPSVKSLQGDIKGDSKPVRPLTVSSKPSSQSSSKEDVQADNLSQTSVGGGIKDKLTALFSKEQTISESSIANKFKLEREKEMEMLHSRFQYNKNKSKTNVNESDDDQSEQENSENAPLMGSTLSLSQIIKKPEIIGQIAKVTFEEPKCKPEATLHEKKCENDSVGVQPVKRRSSQDSQAVLSVLEDVKRIKINKRKEANGAIVQQPASLYPHLSDIETDTSNTNDEKSDCGSSLEREKLNKSDNWADTSFGREVMNVVKKNNTSYKKAVRGEDTDSSCSNDSELDDLLDEALDDESEGPTPPKVNKNSNCMSSRSFTYQDGTPKKKEFKSPLKITNTPVAKVADKSNELVHSVSFYRRMQNASSQPSTPIRVVRHGSPERSPPRSPQEQTSAVTVRERIRELQNEIAKQQTIISQASQALNLCAATIEFSGSTEQAEGERLLLLASHRRQACVHEVQRLQVEGAGPAARAGHATLQLKDIKLPLRRDYVRVLNADGAVGHHAVCLLKCRDRVLASSMQLTKPTSNILHFPDEIRMDGLTSDFKVTVEVYLLQASKEVLPHDVKYHISSKKSSSKLLTPKSKSSKELKAPKIQSPAGPLTVRTPQFQHHGYCIFALPQANRKSFTLNKVACGSPLEGTLNVDITARLRLAAPSPHSAFLTAFDDVSGLGAWHRRWFLLQSPRLTYWKYPDDVHKKMPIGDIDLSTVISEKATKAPRDLCARPHTILLETSVPAGLVVPETGSLVYLRRSDGTVARRHLLAADTAADRDTWIQCLNNALEYVRCCSTDEE